MPGRAPADEQLGRAYAHTVLLLTPLTPPPPRTHTITARFPHALLPYIPVPSRLRHRPHTDEQSELQALAGILGEHGPTLRLSAQLNLSYLPPAAQGAAPSRSTPAFRQSNRCKMSLAALSRTSSWARVRPDCPSPHPPNPRPHTRTTSLLASHPLSFPTRILSPRRRPPQPLPCPPRVVQSTSSRRPTLPRQLPPPH